MPIATPEVYAEMLDRAKAGAFAYPAINVTSSQTLNAALRGLRRGRDRTASSRSRPAARSTCPGRASRTWSRVPWRSRSSRMWSPTKYPITVALHTDHCPKDKLDGYVRPLLAVSQERVDARRGAAVPVAHVGRLGGRRSHENLEIAQRAAGRMRQGATSIMEMEIGVVGGEEDGVVGEINEKLYSTPEDALLVGRRARPRRERPLHARRDVRQRARRLQAGQRQAAPVGAEADPGRRRREGRQGQAVRPRLPRRLAARRWRRSARPSTTASSR